MPIETALHYRLSGTKAPPSLLVRSVSLYCLPVAFAALLCSGCAPESSGESQHTTATGSTAAGSTAAGSTAVDSGSANSGSATAAASSTKADSSKSVKPNEIMDITFDDLKLEMPESTLFASSMLTPRVQEIDGRNVRLRGFIFPGGVFQSTGITKFPFVMNLQCKFGPQGLAYCVILVELDEGVRTDFTTYPITVEGELNVQPFNLDGFTWSVYHMRGTKVF